MPEINPMLKALKLGGKKMKAKSKVVTPQNASEKNVAQKSEMKGPQKPGASSKKVSDTDMDGD